ncbi:unnamed protein product [Urochloa humidicola]
MIHKKLVLSPSVPINVVMRENIRAPSGIVLPVSQQTCSIDGPKSVAVKPQCNEMEKLCVDVEPTSYVLGFDNSPIGSSFVSRGPLVDPMEVTNFESIKRAADDDHGSHVKQQHLEISPNAMSYIAAIPMLVGSNYAEWRTGFDMAVVMTDIDTAINTPYPAEPVAPVRQQNETDEAFAARECDYAPVRASYDLEKRKWDISNKKCLLIMRTKISEAIRSSIPEKKADGVAHTAPEYMALVQTQFTGSSKFYTRTLIDQFLNTKYTGGGVREHILKLSNIHGKLAAFDMKLPEDFLVHTVFRSLPSAFSSFEISYNSLEEKWDLQKLIARYVQDEDRMIAQGGGQINYVNHKKKKPFPKHFKAKNQWESGPSNAPNQNKGKAPV